MPGTDGAERTPPFGQIAFTCAHVHGWAWSQWVASALGELQYQWSASAS